MEVKLSPVVQHYRDNLEEYHTSEAAGFFLRHIHRPHYAHLTNTPLTPLLQSMQTISEPWKAILSNLSSLSREELEWLDATMPPSWARAKVEEELHAR